MTPMARFAKKQEVLCAKDFFANLWVAAGSVPTGLYCLFWSMHMKMSLISYILMCQRVNINRMGIK